MEDEHFIQLFINTVSNYLCITHFCNNVIHNKAVSVSWSYPQCSRKSRTAHISTILCLTDIIPFLTTAKLLLIVLNNAVIIYLFATNRTSVGYRVHYYFSVFSAGNSGHPQ